MTPSRHYVRHAAWIGRTVATATTAIGAAIDGRTGPEGYCLSRTTLEPDATALAAPIHNAEGTIAALSVTSPTYRMTDEPRHGRRTGWSRSAAL